MSKEIEAFIEKRPELAESRKVMLRYLANVSDVISIEERPKGRSVVKCEFDCGAYKGSEVIEIRMDRLTPMRIALSLEGLTSGHHFSFPEADEVLLQSFSKRAA